MAFILTPQGIPDSGGVPTIMPSPRAILDGLGSEATVGEPPRFNKQLVLAGIASERALGIAPRFRTIISVEGFEDG